MNQFYDGCRDATDVDRITSIRINQVHGPVPGDELKNLRRGMLALVSLAKPSLFNKKDLNDLLAMGDRLLVLNAAIENIVNEGRAYKKEKGWA
jgi:hypothetical protein